MPSGVRRYPRIKPPKGLRVAWQSASQRFVSRVETLGLGGLFISTPDPPAAGTIIALLIDLPGGEVRARAIVRSVLPRQGMGVEIMSMRQEDRARLGRFLRTQAR